MKWCKPTKYQAYKCLGLKMTCYLETEICPFHVSKYLK